MEKWNDQGEKHDKSVAKETKVSRSSKEEKKKKEPERAGLCESCIFLSFRVRTLTTAHI